MFQEIAKVSAIVAAGMVGIASIGNAVGRIFWAWTSDALTRRWTFVVMFLVQVGLFWMLPSIASASRPYRRVIHHSDVLRRRFRHHAGICSRLLWIEKCRSDLRPDDHRMGFAQRIRAAADRSFAPSERVLRQWTSRHCRHHGRVRVAAHLRLAAQGAKQLRRAKRQSIFRVRLLRLSAIPRSPTARNRGHPN